MLPVAIYKKYFNSSLGFGKYKPLVIQLLKDTIQILDKLNIEYFIISGTLLGYIRHNDIIPWDDDMDLIVDYKILDNLESIKNIYIDSRNKYMLKAMCNDKTKWPFIDLFIYSYSEDKSTISFFNKQWDVNEFFPAEKKPFLNTIVSIPKNPHYFLERNYGKEYMTVLKSSIFNHKKNIVTRPIESLDISIYNELCKSNR